MPYFVDETDFLAHYGIRGQRWGVRRYQNPDGSLTDAGKRRYSTNAKKGSLRYELKANKAYAELSKESRKHKLNADAALAGYNKSLFNQLNPKKRESAKRDSAEWAKKYKDANEAYNASKQRLNKSLTELGMNSNEIKYREISYLATNHRLSSRQKKLYQDYRDGYLKDIGKK